MDKTYKAVNYKPMKEAKTFSKSILTILLTFILWMFLLIGTSSCSKKETPEPEKKFVDVTYVVEFAKNTDFTITGSNYSGTIKDSIWNVQKYVFTGKIEDLNNGWLNAWGGGCCFKAGDKNNILIKVSIVIGADTIKRGQLSTGCLTVN